MSWSLKAKIIIANWISTIFLTSYGIESALGGAMEQVIWRSRWNDDSSLERGYNEVLKVFFWLEWILAEIWKVLKKVLKAFERFIV